MITASAIRSQWFGRIRRPAAVTLYCFAIGSIRLELWAGAFEDSRGLSDASMENHIRGRIGKRKMPAAGNPPDAGADQPDMDCRYDGMTTARLAPSRTVRRSVRIVSAQSLNGAARSGPGSP